MWSRVGSKRQLIEQLKMQREQRKIRKEAKEARKKHMEARREIEKLKKEKTEFEKQKKEIKRLVEEEYKTGEKLAKHQEEVAVRSNANKTDLPIRKATKEVRVNAFQKQISKAGFLRRRASIHNLARGIAMHRINPLEAKQRIAHLSPKEKKILERDYARVMDQHIGRRLGAHMALSAEEQKYLERARKSKSDMAAIRWTAEIERLAEKVAFKGFHRLNKNEASMYNTIMASPSSKKMFKKRYDQLIETF